MHTHPKHINKQLRRLADILYERELNEALARLDGYFAEWRTQKISPFLLSRKIHEFHQGEARELYNQYVPHTNLDIIVARGVALGKLNAEEVPSEVLEIIRHMLENFRRRDEEE